MFPNILLFLGNVELLTLKRKTKAYFPQQVTTWFTEFFTPWPAVVAAGSLTPPPVWVPLAVIGGEECGGGAGCSALCVQYLGGTNGQTDQINFFTH